ncbi:hypothetical protein [uncultured Shewanella sp.]|uniref:hypothetical protein n=1 Tax=uncultured Shewanella sp. TaxID=173975 RepID=UPI002634BC90|nr:hypothetical protein [uncultured Shewanella sp.]
MLQTKYTSKSDLIQENANIPLLAIMAFVIGVCISITQLLLSINTINTLTANSDGYVNKSMITLVILLVLCQPLLIAFLKDTKNNIHAFIAGALLIIISLGSIYTVHYTISDMASTLSTTDQEKLDLAKEDKQAFRGAISKGVVTPTKKERTELDEKINGILDQKPQAKDEVWSFVMSILSEIMVIFCFFMSFSFNSQKEKKDSDDQGGGNIRKQECENYHANYNGNSQFNVKAYSAESHNKLNNHMFDLECDYSESQKIFNDEIERNIFNASVQLKSNGMRVSKAAIAKIINVPREYLSKQYSNEYNQAISKFDRLTHSH